ncbi:MAG: histidine kinase [Nitriliruptoraceae bacterium]
MRGTGPLLAAVTALWAAIVLVSQVLAEPPLSPVATILVGVLITDLLILGYGSTLRGPRQTRRPRRPRSPPPSRSPRPEDEGPDAQARPEGLTDEVVDHAVALLLPLLDGDAVSITDRHRMLAFAGPGRDHHARGSPLYARTRDAVLRTGRTGVVWGRGEDLIGCPEPGCPLRSAAIAALRIGEEIIGSVTVYRTSDDPPRAELVEAAAGILSLHLEVAELESRQRLAIDAELDALRAQINPHFLFNTLNTIASRIRTDPEDARQLLVRLADFFRYAIRQREQFAGFSQEYAFVRTYVTLEQARFGDRLHVEYDIDPAVLSVEVPVLVIQPLVENAVKHGASGNVGRTTVRLRARVDPLARVLDVTVRDDGVGMDEPTLAAITTSERRQEQESSVGLSNIRERLELLFGAHHEFDVRSTIGEGTTVHLRLPMR